MEKEKYGTISTTDNRCPTYHKLDRERKIKELLKDLESELSRPKFEQIKEELLQVLEG